MMDGLTEHVPTIGESLASGALSFASPCILSLFPVALVYVTGVSLERRGASVSGAGREGGVVVGWRLKASLLAHLSSFIFGFIVVLLGLALGHTWVGRVFLGGQRVWMVLGGILVMVMGVFMTGLVPRADQGDLRLRFRHRFLGYLGSAGVGATYGFVWSPCVGPTLGSLILLAGTPGLSGTGSFLLFVHGLGFGAPFLLTGLIFDGLLQGVRSPRIVIILEKTAGVFLAAVGFLIATGRFLSFTDGLFQTFDFWVQVLIQGGL